MVAALPGGRHPHPRAPPEAQPAALRGRPPQALPVAMATAEEPALRYHGNRRAAPCGGRSRGGAVT